MIFFETTLTFLMDQVTLNHVSLQFFFSNK